MKANFIKDAVLELSRIQDMILKVEIQKDSMSESCVLFTLWNGIQVSVISGHNINGYELAIIEAFQIKKDENDEPIIRDGLELPMVASFVKQWSKY